MRSGIVALAVCLLFVGACASDPFTAADAGGDASVDSSADVAPDAKDGAAEAGPRDFLYVFVTSLDHEGVFPPADGGSALDGRSGADAFCKELADGDGSVLPGRRWVAWLSTSGNDDARARLPHTGSALTYGYRLADGVTEVFPKGFDFDVVVDGGDPLPTNPIKIAEHGKVIGTQKVWTGTLQNGRAHAYLCDGWNSSTPDASTGELGSSSEVTVWSASGNFGAPSCTERHRLYCFEVP